MPGTKMVDTELRVWRLVRSYTSHLPAEQKKRLNFEDLCLKGGEVHVKAGGLTYQTSLCNRPASKRAGSFHIHRKTMKELGTLAVLGVREQPNLAHNLVTHRH